MQSVKNITVGKEVGVMERLRRNEGRRCWEGGKWSRLSGEESEGEID